jgi:carbon storage regulator
LRNLFRTRIKAPILAERQDAMLVLSRKAGESILIGDDIEIVITSIEAKRVKVGIKSPPNVPIYREELYRKIREENMRAASIGKDEFDSILEKYSGSTRPDPLDQDDS